MVANLSNLSGKVDSAPIGARQLSNLIPCYNGDAFWFWLDPDTGRRFYPEGTCQPFDEDEHVRWLHEKADETTAFGYCYFIAAETGPVKIGYSACPKDRLRALQSGCPVKLSILAMKKGAMEREIAYHEQFATHRLHGEWFERCPAILAEIERLNPTP